MTIIHLETEIQAPIERCFDLSLDIGVHLHSARYTGERVIAGRSSGICQLHDRITWQARHFGIRQKLTVEITQLERPHFFEDRMLKGAFKSMVHRHYFEDRKGSTMMRDEFCYETPFGIFGTIFDLLLLERHMRRFLLERNRVIREEAERGL